mgnify:CR=1 FL=1
MSSADTAAVLSTRTLTVLNWPMSVVSMPAACSRFRCSATKLGPDEKVILVPLRDPTWMRVHDIHDIPSEFRDEIEHFFQIYKDLEGKRMEVMGWKKSEAAMEIVKESIVRYGAKYGG